MPSGFKNWNVDWLSQNGQRRYPLAADATATDSTGSFQLPDDFITELYIPIHAGLAVQPGRFLIREIGVYAAGYSVIIGYDDGSTVTKIASAVIARSTHVKNTVYNLGGLGDFADTSGRIVIGDIGNIDKQPPGLWQFTLAGARLEPDSIRPIIRGISSFRVKNGSVLSVPVYGDVVFEAGTNQRIDLIQEEDELPIIRWNAIEGEGLNEICACLEEDDVPPIKTINGILPTVAGDFTLLGSDCLETSPIEHGIQLIDTCSKPCCGDPELDAITVALESLRINAATLEQFVGNLESRASQIELAILGAIR